MDQLVFYIVSDSTGATCDDIVKAALSQFSFSNYSIDRYTSIRDLFALREILDTISADDHPKILFYSIVDDTLLSYVKQFITSNKIQSVDILSDAINNIALTVNQNPKGLPGALRELDDEYFKRVDAIEFAVKYDDGKDPKGILQADFTLLGISRTSKTPLSMYLANRGYRVANLPIVPENQMPKEIYMVSPTKIIGLTNSPKNLLNIRKERLVNLGLPQESTYADFNRILDEVSYAMGIMRKIGCPIVDVSNRAIEETSEIIINMLKKIQNKK